jgi:hypothetical protein
MNAIVTSDNLDRAIDEAERLFVEAGQAKVRARGMELRRKRVRAAMFVKHKANVKSAAEAQELAECDPTYELACVDWETVALEAETLEAQAEAKRMKFDAWRSVNATQRAAMNLR